MEPKKLFLEIRTGGTTCNFSQELEDCKKCGANNFGPFNLELDESKKIKRVEVYCFNCNHTEWIKNENY